MEALRFNRRVRPSPQGGFSMIEMLIATVILSVGLLSLAGFMSKMDLSTSQSRYSNAAALLCSEKLEELSGLRPGSEQISLPAGSSIGDLDEDTTSIIKGETISYFDEVKISAANGSIRETKVDGEGKYQTIIQKPNGTAEQETLNTPPDDDEGTITFNRRWLIEKNVPGLPPEVRRITVRVEYPAGPTKAKFQMSMVRNAEQPN